MTAEELKEIWYTPFSYVDSEGKTITTTVLNDTIQNLYNKSERIILCQTTILHRRNF